MPRSTIRRAAAASVVGVLTLSPVAAHAQEPDPDVQPLPCTGELYRFSAAGPVQDRMHERIQDDRYHENSLFAVTARAVPVDGQGTTYTGRITVVHNADNGDSGAGHAVSSFRMLATLHGSDGSLLIARTVAHISATAVPDLDPTAVVRVFFDHSECDVRL